jgi:lipopolysaccharide/colanic/teichoic acid biosynthesis glycosyltransferase
LEELLKFRRFSLAVKRLLDVVASGIGLIILSPIFLFIAIIIKLDSKGNVFFKQIRVGKNGKEFEILKFRTMITNAEKKGMQITVGKDSRITNAGRILRKIKLDELPQLINVFIGEMSLVGPRPEVPKYVAIYTEEQRQVLLIRPGITDRASVFYRNESEILAKSDDPENTYINEIMPEKLRINLEYIKKVSPLTDIGLVIYTIFKVFIHK